MHIIFHLTGQIAIAIWYFKNLLTGTVFTDEQVASQCFPLQLKHLTNNFDVNLGPSLRYILHTRLACAKIYLAL